MKSLKDKAKQKLKKKSAQKAKHYFFRPMKRQDLDQVLAIEKQCFEQPYSREILAQELGISAAHLWVMGHGRKILAYIDFWLVADEIELVSVAVRSKYRRLGLALSLLKRMIDFGQKQGVNAIYLDVRKSNEKAKQLYEKLGFQTVGLRKKYYSDNQEDALILRKNLSQ